MGFDLLINSPQRIIMGLLGEAHRGLEAGGFVAQAQSSPGRGAPPGCLASQGVTPHPPPTHRTFTGTIRTKSFVSCACRGQGSGGMRRERKLPSPEVESSGVYKGISWRGSSFRRIIGPVFSGLSKLRQILTVACFYK